MMAVFCIFLQLQTENSSLVTKVKNMIVRQSKNTFIRTTEKYGYITNQLTWHDRSYNETGSDYFRMESFYPAK